MNEEFDRTYYDYYVAMVSESDMIFEARQYNGYSYVVTEGKDFGDVIVAKFDRDGILLTIEPAGDDVNSVDDYINHLIG